MKAEAEGEETLNVGDGSDGDGGRVIVENVVEGGEHAVQHGDVAADGKGVDGEGVAVGEFGGATVKGKGTVRPAEALGEAAEHGNGPVGLRFGQGVAKHGKGAFRTETAKGEEDGVVARSFAGVSFGEGGRGNGHGGPFKEKEMRLGTQRPDGKITRGVGESQGEG